MTLYKKIGFNNHPFAHTNADEEPYLENYFVSPPYFDAVVGDPEHPSASIVLAPRGGGKSAQRRMLENWTLENAVLGVTYDRFEFSSAQNIDKITLPYHIRNVIVRILLSYLSYLSEYPDLLKQIDKTDKNSLSLFVHSYLI